MRTVAKSWLLTAALVCTLAAWRYAVTTPRVWQPAETPIACWTWRNRTPEPADIQAAKDSLKMQTLFLRAGQIDRTANGPHRIRAVTGALPQACELHLVYNATRALLASFSDILSTELAFVIAETYAQDLQRASLEQARVVGIQLDLDVASRALPRYQQLLLELRQRLPVGTQLSITGLETWLALPELKPVLAVTDFWIPQCYGAEIPRHLQKKIPIATAAQTASIVAAARALDHPFYAGLAAYGYAVLYGTDGQLRELRGDLDPSLVAEHPDLVLVEREPFNQQQRFWFPKTDHAASEWRYVYRAQRDCVIDGLRIRAGESLLLDLPTAASLRECGRAVRENGGEWLRGLCLFRLPGRDDTTTLTLAEITAALADAEPMINFELAATQAPDLTLTATNRGVSSQLGDGAFTVWLHLPPGSFNGQANAKGFSRYETFCSEAAFVRYAEQAPQPCSPRRANLLRLTSHHLRGDERLRFTFTPARQLPDRLLAKYEFHAADGRPSLGWHNLSVTTTAPEQKEQNP